VKLTLTTVVESAIEAEGPTTRAESSDIPAACDHAPVSRSASLVMAGAQAGGSQRCNAVGLLVHFLGTVAFHGRAWDRSGLGHRFPISPLKPSSWRLGFGPMPSLQATQPRTLVESRDRSPAFESRRRARDRAAADHPRPSPKPSIDHGVGKQLGPHSPARGVVIPRWDDHDDGSGNARAC
jgi:hypothetical protein